MIEAKSPKRRVIDVRSNCSLVPFVVFDFLFLALDALLHFRRNRTGPPNPDPLRSAIRCATRGRGPHFRNKKRDRRHTSFFPHARADRARNRLQTPRIRMFVVWRCQVEAVAPTSSRGRYVLTQHEAFKAPESEGRSDCLSVFTKDAQSTFF